jgi:tryptophan halogenase
MKIIIVGGGTAGWLAAFGMSHDNSTHQYTVIDSAKVGIIGVGESTTGALLSFAKKRGISKLDLMLGINALPKYGIKFTNWDNNGGEFISPVDGSFTGSNVIDWALHSSVALQDDLVKNSVGSTIINEDKTDFYIDQNNNIKELYGHFPLHIDTHATGKFFKNKSISNGVKHIDAKVVNVNLDTITGFISSLLLDDGTTIDGDLFIDCSGFSQTLIKKLTNGWVDYSKFLPVNAAVPFNVIGDNRKKQPYTTAKAMSAGWMWEIPTRNVTNRGYIFCDNFISEADALAEIEETYNSDIEKVKSINFSAGRLETPWVKNCVAIGLASAFLEPLQATSIHCTVEQIEDFIYNCLEDTIDRTLNDIVMRNYNSRISTLYSSMADLISLHYAGNRQDTDFWKYITYECPRTDKVNEILTLAKHRGIRHADFDSKRAHAGQAIWHHTLAGLGLIESNTSKQLCLNFKVDLEILKKELEISYSNNLNTISRCMSVDDLNNYFNTINK